MALLPADLKTFGLMVAVLPSATAPDITDPTKFTESKPITPMLIPDLKDSYAVPLRTGSFYQLKIGPNNMDWLGFEMREDPWWPEV